MSDPLETRLERGVEEEAVEGDPELVSAAAAGSPAASGAPG